MDERVLEDSLAPSTPPVPPAPYQRRDQLAVAVSQVACQKDHAPEEGEQQQEGDLQTPGIAAIEADLVSNAQVARLGLIFLHKSRDFMPHARFWDCAQLESGGAGAVRKVHIIAVDD